MKRSTLVPVAGTVVGASALVVLAMVVVSLFPAMRRYLRMKRM